MACKKLGFKSEVFHLDGQSWICSTGLPSDVVVQVGDTSFHLHKFPLLSRSRLLEKLIQDSSEQEKNEKVCVLQLHGIPGGAKAFLKVAKFCYGVKMELTARNVVSLRCAAEYLQMNEDYGEVNLIAQTESFLIEVFGFWTDSFKALETCEDVLPWAEELHIVSRCIDSLSTKACADPTLLSWPVAGHSSTQSQDDAFAWNGIHASSAASKQCPLNEDWWYEDVSFLKQHIYRKLIHAVSARGMTPEIIAGSLIFYAKKHLPLNGRQSNFQKRNGAVPGSTLPTASDADQRTLLEEIVGLLPEQKGIIPTKFLLRLLKTSMILEASKSCRENLERRAGAQLDEAALEDILIPNMGHSVETLYDIDCIQRIVDHFMMADQDEIEPTSNELTDEGQLVGGSDHSLTPLTIVANLVDGYLAEVAPDTNLKLTKFNALASAIPGYARPLDDGIYRAIDIYLKAHSWLTGSEREQLCRVMNCQKLSLEASTHAAQNERLPLRVIVQVLFFEQLRLRTSVAGWLFVSDNLDNSQSLSGNLVHEGTRADQLVTFDDMRDRVRSLEKECLNMKEDVDKLVKAKGSWNNIFKLLGLRLKVKSCGPKSSSKIFSSGKVLQHSRKAVMNLKEEHSAYNKDD
ncbi:BTB/POZ domain-containing protein At5g03250-like [Nicotiana tabacum]|uniref:BTB/POZ domain-containing protein At5g03250-like n=1 Tax=Nicotiana tabacum TaxID=4097 RepID=A0A1S3YCM1_TOBAC